MNLKMSEITSVLVTINVILLLWTFAMAVGGQEVHCEKLSKCELCVMSGCTFEFGTKGDFCTKMDYSKEGIHDLQFCRFHHGNYEDEQNPAEPGNHSPATPDHVPDVFSASWYDLTYGFNNLSPGAVVIFTLLLIAALTVIGILVVVVGIVRRKCKETGSYDVESVGRNGTYLKDDSTAEGIELSVVTKQTNEKPIPKPRQGHSQQTENVNAIEEVPPSTCNQVQQLHNQKPKPPPKPARAIVQCHSNDQNDAVIATPAIGTAVQLARPQTLKIRPHDQPPPPPMSLSALLELTETEI